MAVLATRAEVARLYGRAGFGATAADLDRGTKMTYEELVLSLFPPSPADVRVAAPDDSDRVLFEGSSSDAWREMYGPITWWTERMRTGAWPLEERLTLFWHDHFATAFIGPPNTDVLTIQNQTLRIHSLGDFRALCHAVTVDAAMLIWLDGRTNQVGAVNENYAREFFELFTIGARPPGATGQEYDEAAIQAAAKALSGWRWTHPRTVEFSPRHHDPTLDDQGNVVGLTLWGHQVCVPGGDHATDHVRLTHAALTRPGAARYVASQLVRALAYVPDPEVVLAGADPLVERVAAALRPADYLSPTSRWDVGAAVRTLLLAPEWRGTQPPERQGARTPLETLVHGAKVLGVDLYRYELVEEPSPTRPLGVRAYERKFVDAAAQAGQMPFYPPGVGGWPAGDSWFSTTNNLSRYDILHRLYDDWAAQPLTARVLLPPSADLAQWTAFMGLAVLSANTVAQIDAFLAAAPLDEAVRQRGVFLLIGTSPDWQVL